MTVESALNSTEGAVIGLVGKASEALRGFARDARETATNNLACGRLGGGGGGSHFGRCGWNLAELMTDETRALAIFEHHEAGKHPRMGRCGVLGGCPAQTDNR